MTTRNWLSKKKDDFDNWHIEESSKAGEKIWTRETEVWKVMGCLNWFLRKTVQEWYNQTATAYCFRVLWHVDPEHEELLRSMKTAYNLWMDAFRRTVKMQRLVMVSSRWV